jgi:hypothetical protein
MFIWQQEMERLDIPVQHIALLQRSLGDIQVALPGLPSQRATAYLCVYGEEQGLRIAVALHLKASRRVVFYLNDEGAVDRRQAQRVLQQGTQFVEAMGFLLGDVDLQRLRQQERAAMWDALPLRGGDPEAPSETSAGAQPPLPTETVSRAETVRRDEPEPPSMPLPVATLRRSPPTAEELEKYRERLLEHLGRFLASF